MPGSAPEMLPWARKMFERWQPSTLLNHEPLLSPAVNTRLRMSVNEWRVVGERAAVPVENWIDIRARARIIEVPLVTFDHCQVEAIRMAMPTPRMSIVQ